MSARDRGDIQAGGDQARQGILGHAIHTAGLDLAVFEIVFDLGRLHHFDVPHCSFKYHGNDRYLFNVSNMSTGALDGDGFEAIPYAGATGNPPCMVLGDHMVIGVLFTASFYQGSAKGSSPYSYLAVSYNIQGVVIYGTRPAPVTTPSRMAGKSEPVADDGRPSPAKRAKLNSRP